MNYFLKKLLEKYSPEEFISFLNKLEIETFTGSSGKIFPVSMTGDDTLGKILEYLESSPLFSFHGNCRLVEIDADMNLVFEKRAAGEAFYNDAFSLKPGKKVKRAFNSDR